MLAGMGGTIWDGAMIAALAAARAAAVRHDVPVGAVVLDPGGDVVATAGNEREQRQDPTAYAEVLALRAAAQSAGTWRLDGHTLEVRFYERGAGETMSSGTGSTGAAAAGLHLGWVTSPVTIRTPAGPLEIRSEDEMFLVGPAQIIGGGEFYFESHDATNT